MTATRDSETLLDVPIRYFAAAGEAAGIDTENLALPGAATVGDVRAELGARHGSELARILSMSALLIGGRTDVPETTPLADVLEAGTSIDVLPPFAGG